MKKRQRKKNVKRYAGEMSALWRATMKRVGYLKEIRPCVTIAGRKPSRPQYKEFPAKNRRGNTP